MKRWILMVSFFYVSWNVCVDSGYDYTGKKEDRYGVKRSTIPLNPQLEQNSGRIIFAGGKDCESRHVTFETLEALKDFLRKAPQSVSHMNVMELNAKGEFEADFKGNPK